MEDPDFRTPVARKPLNRFRWNLLPVITSWTHHTCKVRISGLKWERAPIVVKYTPFVSIFYFYLYFLCSCWPAQVALWIVWTSLITHNGVFVVDQSKEDISDCKGLRTLPWQPNFGQNRPKCKKNGHNFSCMQHMHAEFGFEIGFVPSGNSSVTLPYTRDKGTLPWQPILWLKLL